MNRELTLAKACSAKSNSWSKSYESNQKPWLCDFLFNPSHYYSKDHLHSHIYAACQLGCVLDHAEKNIEKRLKAVHFHKKWVALYFFLMCLMLSVKKTEHKHEKKYIDVKMVNNTNVSINANVYTNYKAKDTAFFVCNKKYNPGDVESL